MNQAALTAEAAEGGHGRRVVRLFHPDAKQASWVGTYGTAPVDVGEPAYQLSDGQVITV